jgi:hypothetical protein
MRFDGRERNSADRINVAAEPISARTFRKRAKSSTMKLPPKVVSLPAGNISSRTPATISSRIDSQVTACVVPCPR